MYSALVALLSLSFFVTMSSPTLATSRESEEEKKNSTTETKEQGAFIQPTYSGEAPLGRVRGTGTRGEGCDQMTHLSITPLLPEDSRGLTTRQSPNIWFYVSYDTDQMKNNSVIRAEFALEDVNTYQGELETVTLPQQSGLFSLKVPESLKMNQWYRWYLSLDCSSSQTAQQDITVWEGLIKRVSTDTSSEENFAQNGIWYDALQQVAENQCNKASDWRSLLSAVGLTEVANQTHRECGSLN